jgi:hypothetical protein
MSIVAWPTSIKVGAVDYGVENDVQINVKRSGGIATYGLPGARWIATISFEPELETMQRPAIEAMLMKLEGGANRLQMPHWGRPIPNGTLRGLPTLGQAASAGAKSLQLASANGTLKAGDILGVAGQIVMVLDDASPSGGSITVNITPAVRIAQSVGAAVTWNAPTTLWVPKSSTCGPFPYQPSRVRPGFSVDFIEAYS